MVESPRFLMTAELARQLLGLFGAVAADGGEQVMRRLADALARIAPFDEGELLLTLVADLHRRPLGTSGASVVEDDLLQHLADHAGPLRVDRLSEAAALPRTRTRLAERRHQSLLALPIAPDETLRGAVALAARRPCAFAAVALQGPTLLAAAAGLALLQSLKLTGLHDEQDSLKGRIEAQRDELEGAQQERERLVAQVAAARGEIERLRAAQAARRGGTRDEVPQGHSSPQGGEHSGGGSPASRSEKAHEAAPPVNGPRRSRRKPE